MFFYFTQLDIFKLSFPFAYFAHFYGEKVEVVRQKQHKHINDTVK